MAISSNQIDVMSLGSLDVSPEDTGSTVSIPSVPKVAVKIPSVHPSSIKSSNKTEEDYSEPFRNLKKAKAKQAQADVFKTYIEALQERYDALAQTQETKEEKADIKAAEKYYKDRLKPLSISEIDRQERDNQLLEEYNAKIANNPEQKDMLLGELAQKREAIIQERQLEEQGLAPWEEININPLDPYAQTFDKKDQKALSSYYTRQEQAEKIRPLINSKVLDKYNFRKMTVTMDDLDSGTMQSGLFGGAQGFRLASTDRLGRQLPMLDGIDAYEVAVQHATKFATQAPLVRAILGKDDNEAISKQEWDNTKIYSMYIALKAYHGDNTPEAYNPTKIQQYQDYIEKNKTFDIYVKELNEGRTDDYGRKIVDFMTENFESPVAKFTYDPMLNASFNMSKTADYIETTRRISDAQYAILKKYRERVQAYNMAKDDKNSYPVELIDILQRRTAELFGQAITLSDTMEEFMSNFFMGKGAGAFREFVNNRYKMNMEFGVNSVKYDEYLKDMQDAGAAFRDGNYIKSIGISASNLPIILTESTPDVVAGLAISAALASTGVGLGIAPEVMASTGSTIIRAFLASGVLSAAAQTAQDIQEFKELHKRDMTREEAVRAYIANDFAYGLDFVLGGGVLGRLMPKASRYLIATPHQVAVRTGYGALASIGEEALSEFGQEYFQNAISQANIKGANDSWADALWTEMKDFKTHGFEGMVGALAAATMSASTQPFAMKNIADYTNKFEEMKRDWKEHNYTGTELSSPEAIKFSATTRDDFLGKFKAQADLISKSTDPDMQTVLDFQEQVLAESPKLTRADYDILSTRLRELQYNTLAYYYEKAMRANDADECRRIIKKFADAIIPEISEKTPDTNIDTNSPDSLFNILVDTLQTEVLGSAPSLVAFLKDDADKDPSLPYEFKDLGNGVFVLKEDFDILMKVKQLKDPSITEDEVIQELGEVNKNLWDVNNDFMYFTETGHSTYQLTRDIRLLSKLASNTENDLNTLIQAHPLPNFTTGGSTFVITSAQQLEGYIYSDGQTKKDFDAWLDSVEGVNNYAGSTLTDTLHRYVFYKEMHATDGAVLHRMANSHSKKILAYAKTLNLNPTLDTVEVPEDTSDPTAKYAGFTFHRKEVLNKDSKTSKMLDLIFNENESACSSYQYYINTITNPITQAAELQKLADFRQRITDAKEELQEYRRKADLFDKNALPGDTKMSGLLYKFFTHNNTARLLIGASFNMLDAKYLKFGEDYFYDKQQGNQRISEAKIKIPRDKTKYEKALKKDKQKYEKAIIDYISKEAKNKDTKVKDAKGNTVYNVMKSMMEQYLLTEEKVGSHAQFLAKMVGCVTEGNYSTLDDFNNLHVPQNNLWDIRRILLNFTEKQRANFEADVDALWAQAELIRPQLGDNYKTNANLEFEPTDCAMYNNIMLLHNIIHKDAWYIKQKQQGQSQGYGAPSETVGKDVEKVITKSAFEQATKDLNIKNVTEADEHEKFIKYLLDSFAEQGKGVKKVVVGNTTKYLMDRATYDSLEELLAVRIPAEKFDSELSYAPMFNGRMNLKGLEDSDVYVFSVADPAKATDKVFVETVAMDDITASSDTHIIDKNDSFSVDNEKLCIKFKKADGTEVSLQFKDAFYFMYKFSDGSDSSSMIEQFDVDKFNSMSKDEQQNYLYQMFQEASKDKDTTGYIINGETITADDVANNPTIHLDYAYFKALQDSNIDIESQLKGITKVLSKNKSTNNHKVEAELVARALALHSKVNSLQDLKNSYGNEDPDMGFVGTEKQKQLSNVLSTEGSFHKYELDQFKDLVIGDINNLRQTASDIMQDYFFTQNVISYKGLCLENVTKIIESMTEDELLEFLGEIKNQAKIDPTLKTAIAFTKVTPSPEAFRFYTENLDSIAKISILQKYMEQYQLGMEGNERDKFYREHDIYGLKHEYTEDTSWAVLKGLKDKHNNEILSKAYTALRVLTGKNFINKDTKAIDIEYEKYIKGFWWLKLKELYRLYNTLDSETQKKYKPLFEAMKDKFADDVQITLTDSAGNSFTVGDPIGSTINGTQVVVGNDINALGSYNVVVIDTEVNTNSPYEKSIAHVHSPIIDGNYGTVYITQGINKATEVTKATVVLHNVIVNNIKNSNNYNNQSVLQRDGHGEYKTLHDTIEDIFQDKTKSPEDKIVEMIQALYRFEISTTAIQNILNDTTLQKVLKVNVEDFNGKTLKDIVDLDNNGRVKLDKKKKVQYKEGLNLRNTQIEVDGEVVPYGKLGDKLNEFPDLLDLQIAKSTLRITGNLVNTSGTSIGNPINVNAEIMTFNTNSVAGIQVASNPVPVYTKGSNFDAITKDLNHAANSIATIVLGDEFSTLFEEVINGKYEAIDTSDFDQSEVDELTDLLRSSGVIKEPKDGVIRQLPTIYTKGNRYLIKDKKGKFKLVSKNNAIAKFLLKRKRKTIKANNAIVTDVKSYIESAHQYLKSNGVNTVRIVLNMRNKAAFKEFSKALKDYYSADTSVELILVRNKETFGDGFLTSITAGTSLSADKIKKSPNLLRLIAGIYGNGLENETTDIIFNLGSGSDINLFSGLGNTAFVTGHILNFITEDEREQQLKSINEARENAENAGTELSEEEEQNLNLIDPYGNEIEVEEEEEVEPYSIYDDGNDTNGRIIIDNTDAFAAELKNYKSSSKKHFDSLFNKDSSLQEQIVSLTGANVVDIRAMFEAKINVENAAKTRLEGVFKEEATMNVFKALSEVFDDAFDIEKETNPIKKYLYHCYHDREALVPAIKRICPQFSVSYLFNSVLPSSGIIESTLQFRALKELIDYQADFISGPANYGTTFTYRSEVTNKIMYYTAINKKVKEEVKKASNNVNPVVANAAKLALKQNCVAEVLRKYLETHEKERIVTPDMFINYASDNQLGNQLDEALKNDTLYAFVKAHIKEAVKFSKEVATRDKNKELRKLIEDKPATDASLLDKLKYQQQYEVLGGDTTNTQTSFNTRALINELIQQRTVVEASKDPMRMAEYNTCVALARALDPSTQVTKINISDDLIDQANNVKDIRERVQEQSKKAFDHSLTPQQKTLKDLKDKIDKASDQASAEQAWNDYLDFLTEGLTSFRMQASSTIERLNTLLDRIPDNERILKDGVRAETSIISSLKDNGRASEFLNKSIDEILKGKGLDDTFVNETLKPLIEGAGEAFAFTLEVNEAKRALDSSTTNPVFQLLSEQLTDRYFKDSFLKDSSGRSRVLDITKMTNKELAQIIIAVANSDPSFLLLYDVQVLDSGAIRLNLRKEVIAAMISASYSTMTMFSNISNMDIEGVARMLNVKIEPNDTAKLHQMMKSVQNAGSMKSNVTRQLGGAVLDALSVRYNNQPNNPNGAALGNTILVQALGNFALRIADAYGIVTTTKKTAAECKQMGFDNVTTDIDFIKFNKSKNASFVNTAQALSNEVFDVSDDIKDVMNWDKPFEQKNKLPRGSDFRSTEYEIDQNTGKPVIGPDGKPKVYNSLSQQTKKFLQIMNNTAFRLTYNDMQQLNDICDHQQELARSMGVKSEAELANMTAEERTAAEGENNSIWSNIKSVVALRDMINDRMKKRKTADIPSMYFDWEQIVSGRYQIKGNLFNPQNNKLLRSVLVPEASLVEFDFNNRNHLNDEIFALAQSFDCMSRAKREGIKELIKDCDLEASKGINLGTKIYESTFTCDDKAFAAMWIKYGLEVEDRGLIIQAALHLQHRCQAKIEGKTTFMTNLMVEDDSTTSGYFLKMALYPNTKVMNKYGIKVGTVTDEYKLLTKFAGYNYDELTDIDLMKKMDGFYDIYKQGAIGSQLVLSRKHFLEDLLKTALDDESFIRPELAKKVNISLLTEILEQTGVFENNGFINSLPKATKEGSVYKVSKEFREMLKPIIMIFGYAAGHNSIVRQVGTTFYESNLDRLKEIISKDSIADYVNNLKNNDFKTLAPIFRIFAFNLQQARSQAEEAGAGDDKIRGWAGIKLSDSLKKRLEVENNDLIGKILVDEDSDTFKDEVAKAKDDIRKEAVKDLLRFQFFYNTAVHGLSPAAKEGAKNAFYEDVQVTKDTSFNLSDIQVTLTENNTTTYVDAITDLLAETYGEAIYESLKDFAPFQEVNNIINLGSNIQTCLFQEAFKAELDTLLEQLNPKLVGMKEGTKDWDRERGIAFKRMTTRDFNKLKKKLIVNGKYPTFPNAESILSGKSDLDKYWGRVDNLMSGLQIVSTESNNIYMDALISMIQEGKTENDPIRVSSYDIYGRWDNVGSAGQRTAVTAIHSTDGYCLNNTVIKTAVNNPLNGEPQSVSTTIHDAFYRSAINQSEGARAYNTTALAIGKYYHQLFYSYGWLVSFVNNYNLPDAAIAEGSSFTADVWKNLYLSKLRVLAKAGNTRAKDLLQKKLNGLLVEKDGTIKGTKLSAIGFPSISRNTVIAALHLEDKIDSSISTAELYDQVTIADILKEYKRTSDMYYDTDYGMHTQAYSDYSNMYSTNLSSPYAKSKPVRRINEKDVQSMHNSFWGGLDPNPISTEVLIDAANSSKEGILQLLETLGQNENVDYIARLHNLLGDLMDVDSLHGWTVRREKIKGNNRGGTKIADKEIILQQQALGHTIAGFSQSNSEIYVHELIHALFDFAFTSNDPAVRRCITRLRALRDYVIEKNLITEDDFYDATGISSEQAKENAGKYYDYIFNEAKHNDAGLREFLSYVLTNEKVFGKLRNVKIESNVQNKRSLFGVILDTVVRMFKVLFGKMSIDQAVEELNNYITGTTLDEDTTIYESAVKLCMDIKKANSRAGTMLQKAKGMVEVATGAVNAIRDTGNEFVAPVIKNLSNIPGLQLTLAKGSKVEIMAKMLALAPFNKDIRQGLHDYFGYMGKEMTRGWLNDVIDDMKSNDEYSFDVAKFDRRTTQIDKMAKEANFYAAKRLREAFKTNSNKETLSELTLDDEDALEFAVRGNMQCWLDSQESAKSAQKIQSLLTDSDYRHRCKQDILQHNAIDEYYVSKDIKIALPAETQKSLMQLVENLANFEAAIMVNAKGTTFFSSYDNARTLLDSHKDSILAMLNKTTGKKTARYDEVVADKLAKKIDQLASLIYMDIASKKENGKLERLSKLSDTGLAYFLGAHRMYKNNASKVASIAEQNKEIGIVPTTTNFHCVEDLVIKPLASSDVMEYNGYKLLNDELMTRNANETIAPKHLIQRDKYGLFLRDLTIKQRTDGTVLSLQGTKDASTDISRMLTDCYDLDAATTAEISNQALSYLQLGHSKENVEKIKESLAYHTKKKAFEKVLEAENKAFFEKMFTTQGTYRGFENMILTSQYDGTRFKPYTYSDLVSKMNLDTNGVNLLSKMLSTQAVVNESYQANNALFDILNAYFQSNKTGFNGAYRDRNSNMRFVDIKDQLIENFGTSVSELFKVKKMDHFYVREDMVKSLLGVKSFSLANWSNANTGKNVIPPQVRAAVIYAEKLLRLLGFKSKENEVVRTPKVLLGNIISNINIHLASESNIFEILSRYMTNTQATYKYLKESKEASLLTFDLEKLKGIKNPSDDVLAKIKKLEQRINLLESSMDNSVIAPLMNNDMFTNIVEDLSALDQEDIADLTTKLANNTYIKNTPGLVKNAFANIYMLRGTLLFEMMSHVNQMADFVARATEYQIQMKKYKGDKKTERYKAYEKQVLNWVWEAFINYHRPIHRMEAYANDIGLLKYTKYIRGSQAVMLRMLKNNPFGVVIQMIRQSIFKTAGLPETENIFTGNLFNKNWSNVVATPIENAENVLMPGLGHFFGMYKD